jgi:hypothetical protein
VHSRGIKLVGVMGVSVTALLLSGAAAAENAKAPATQQTERPILQRDAERQEAAPKGEVAELSKVGSQLKEAQDQAEIAASRAQELDQQTRTLRCAEPLRRKGQRRVQGRGPDQRLDHSRRPPQWG